MNINLSGANNTETQKAAARKTEERRQSGALEASFKRFKETMPDGSIDERALEALRLRLEARSEKRLQFMVDRGSGQVMVKVIDAHTDKVITVLPPKELLRKSGRIKEDTGILLDKMI